MTRLPFLASTFRQRRLIDPSKRDSGWIRFISQKIKREGKKKITASIFARDVASTIRSLSGGISFFARYFYENSRTNVQVRFILKGESDLLNLFSRIYEWTIYFIHVYVWMRLLCSRRYDWDDLSRHRRHVWMDLAEKKDGIVASRKGKSAVIS